MRAPSPPARRRYGPAADVAERLRSSILAGRFADGDVLPKIDDLSDEYGASRPAVREALLMLEAEGLVTVKRGNVGGAVVHVPSPGHMAYTLSLVLQSRDATLHDVRAAIERFEPICVELCAERDDRLTTVVPPLRAAQDAYRAALDRDDSTAAVRAARQWHEALTEHCGNETVRATVGMLEAIWSSHLRSIAADTVMLGGHISPERSRRGADEHDEVIRLIAAGDATAAAAVARRHLRDARIHAERPDELDATVSSATMRDPRPLAP